jgi:hypothetical protein
LYEGKTEPGGRCDVKHTRLEYVYKLPKIAPNKYIERGVAPVGAASQCDSVKCIVSDTSATVKVRRA